MQRTKQNALLAISFSAGMLCSPMPALCEDKIEAPDSKGKQVESNFENESVVVDLAIQRNETNPNNTPEMRAYHLLNTAFGCLYGGDRHQLETSLRQIPDGFFNNMVYLKDKYWEDWAERVATDGLLDGGGEKIKTKAGSRSIMEENSDLVEIAIQKALPQLEQTTNPYTKLTMYFIALKISEKAKLADETKKCSEILQRAFKSCEGNEPIDESKVKAASSVLNAMAYGLIPFRIPNIDPKENQMLERPTIKPFNDDDFNKGELLKRRALAMADRLPSTNDLRRRSHRDLALWYAQLGRPEKAEKEKRVLFDLVGTTDESILYGQNVGCGNIVWWQTNKLSMAALCGMG